MADVVYVMLTSGQELIASLVGETTDSVTLARPMSIESLPDDEDPGRRLVYMTRFAPYAAVPTVTISVAAVAIRSLVTPVVAQYYESSLSYCETFNDAQFIEGMNDTLEHIENALRDERDRHPPAPAGVSVGTDRNQPDAFETLFRHFMTHGGSSNTGTCH